MVIPKCITSQIAYPIDFPQITTEELKSILLIKRDSATGIVPDTYKVGIIPVHKPGKG